MCFSLTSCFLSDHFISTQQGEKKTRFNSAGHGRAAALLMSHLGSKCHEHMKNHQLGFQTGKFHSVLKRNNED